MLALVSPEVLAAIGGLVTAAGAALWKLVKLFLDAMSSQQKEFTTFLGNHMSENRRAVEAAARATERVADRLEQLEDKIR